MSEMQLKPYMASDKWTIIYDDGRSEEVCIGDDELFHVPGGPKLGRIIHLVQEFEDEEVNLYQFGIGADWFWKLTVNDSVIADYMEIGNQYTPIFKGNHIIQFQSQKGKNKIDIEVKSGSVTWSVAFGGIPLDYNGFAELLDSLKKPNKLPKDNYIQNLLPSDFFEKISKGDFSSQFYPDISDRTAWDKVRNNSNYQVLIKEIFEQADKILGESIPVLLFSDYRRYIIDGDRSTFERNYFDRRKKLNILVAVCALSNNTEKYLPEVFNYLRAILDEWTWCVSAHMCWNKDTLYPQKNYQCDIFTAQTCLELTMIVNVLGSVFNSCYPEIIEEIREKVLTRGVYNALSVETFDKNAWFSDEIPGNWTPWCCACLTTAAAVFEKDHNKLAEILQTYTKCVSRYLYYYPDDGYCMEGPTYFSVAVGNVFYMSNIFDKLYPKGMKQFYSDQKVRNMFEFIANVSIKNSLVTFSDSGSNSAETYRTSGFIKCCAEAINSDKLRQLGNQQPNGKNLGYWQFFHLSVLLMTLFDTTNYTAVADSDDSEIYCYEDKLMVFKSDKLAVSLKGGTNAEYHNHNDLGHFSIWNKGEIIIADAGGGLYNKEYFSVNRYKIWNTRAKGHNAIVFDDIEQQQGQVYQGKIKCSYNIAECDLSNAYPLEAGVINYKRFVEFDSEKITIEDKFDLQNKKKANIHLLTPIKPQINGNTINLGEVSMILEDIEFEACNSVEDLIGRKPANWQELYELKLSSSNDNFKITFKI